MKDMNWEGIDFEAGYFNSPCASLGRRTSISGHAKTWELMLCDREGTVSRNDEDYTVTAGDVLCLCPGDHWRISLPFCGYYVRIHDKQGTLGERIRHWPPLFSVQRPEDMIALVCTAAQAQDAHDTLTGMAALLSIISALDAQQHHTVSLDSSTSPKMRDSLRAGLAYIQEHYREKCTLNEIAAHAGRSPIYFHDVFQKAMDMTPYEYIAQLRLAEAKRRLTMTDEDPVDIAQSCGFCSQSYFNFVFKKAMGMTPLNYRRRAAAKYLENNE